MCVTTYHESLLIYLTKNLQNFVAGTECILEDIFQGSQCDIVTIWTHLSPA